MSRFLGLNWYELFVPSLSVVEAVFRGTVLFCGIIAIFRLIPKRLLGRLALSDLLVVTVVAGVARNGLIRDAYSITDALMVIGTIVAWSYLFDWASYRSPFIHSLLHHDPVRLIKDGVVDEAKLRKEMVTPQQLRAQLRREVNVDSPDRIAEAWIEGSGGITAKLKDDGANGWRAGDNKPLAMALGLPGRSGGGKRVLLLIDVINDLNFDEGEEVLRFALPMAEKLAALAQRAREAGIPVIYVNDNFGHWRSDFRATVEHCLHDGVRGRPVVEKLLPQASDYFVLKPRHSGFYSTTLETLLRHLEAETLIVTGIAGNICVLFTAYDAYLRGYRVLVPRDCVASNTQSDTDNALAEMRKVLKAETPLSKELEFRDGETPLSKELEFSDGETPPWENEVSTANRNGAKR